MGSGYFGEMNNIEKRRSGSATTTTSSGRRGRKSGSGGEKPKQPQRGLGVAQLEKIRLHGEMGCSAYGHFAVDDMRMQTAASSFSYSTTAQSSSSSSPSYGFHQNFMGMGEYERGSFRYGDSQPSTSIRWDQSNTFLETQHFGQPNMTGHLFNHHVQESMHKNMNTKYGSDSIGSSSQNSESSETQELDLELRLSI